jgi:apolipoprotein N-acyltransferase
MANRYALIVDSSNQNIKEVPSGDTLLADAFTATGAVSASTVTASTSAKITQVALTSSSNAVAWDAAAAANAYHLLTENTTFSAPSNATEGAIISVEIAQGGTPYTVAWHSSYQWAASTAPTVTATANKTDIFSFRYNGTVWQEIGRVQNLAQT